GLPPARRNADLLGRLPRLARPGGGPGCAGPEGDPPPQPAALRLRPQARPALRRKGIPAGGIRDAQVLRLAREVAVLVAHQVGEALHAILRAIERTVIEEVSKEDRVPRADFRADLVHRMVRLRSYSEGVAGVGREAHLQRALEPFAPLGFVKHGAQLLH